VRAAAIFGLGSSEKDLKPFRQDLSTDWLVGLPESPDQADIVLIFGGDGTVHRHLSQLVRLQLPVLVIPRGSGNDFARALGIRSTKQSLAAWEKVKAGVQNVTRIDLGAIAALANGSGDSHYPLPATHYFCCVANVGLDAEVARRANTLPRWLRSHGGYVASLPASLVRFSPTVTRIELNADGRDAALVTRSNQPTVLAAFANTPVYGGGMRIAPRARFDDGRLDACIVGEVSKLKLLSVFPSVYFGRHTGIRGVDYVQAERFRVSTERPLDVYADGEYVCRTPVEISVRPAALPMVVP
jgi:diacylglycerol kinase (ATP)